MHKDCDTEKERSYLFEPLFSDLNFATFLSMRMTFSPFALFLSLSRKNSRERERKLSY